MNVLSDAESSLPSLIDDASYLAFVNTDCIDCNTFEHVPDKLIPSPVSIVDFERAYVVEGTRSPCRRVRSNRKMKIKATESLYFQSEEHSIRSMKSF